MAALYTLQGSQVLVCMCGLPARGKTYIAQKVSRYLTWLSIPTKTFNVGQYRRQGGNAHPPASFFDPNNAEGARMREIAAQEAFNDLMRWYNEENGVVAILDATNSTKKRRQWIEGKCRETGVKLMFVESVCDNEDLVLSNILDVKVSSPDYIGQDPEQAALDFRDRIRLYEKHYETIDEQELTFVKLINIGSQVIINRIQDFLQSRIVYYLMNLHIKPRSIYLSRHGESQYNLDGKIGGDAPLSFRGEQYAKALPNLIHSCIGDTPLTVWTSTLRRTIQTAAGLPYKQLQWKALDELDAGVCDGMTYEEIEEEFPDDFANRDADKFNYRYRGGESYRDVVVRLEPVIMELERQENVLVVCHQAILRCVLGYFMSLPQEELPYVDIPLHTVLKLTPKAFSTQVEKLSVNVPAVSTHRPRVTDGVKNTPPLSPIEKRNEKF